MDGIIIINKPQNCTSHDIVYKVKKLLNEKVGHTGTLDPNATGVLPLLIGKGTLMSKYIVNHDKEYEAVLKLGEKRDTADSEGKVLEVVSVPSFILEESNVQKILKTMIGKQEQIPPIYSAIKVNGKKLYEYARKNETVEIQPRIIEIYDTTLIKIENDEITFRVKCSKGTYIRTVCEEIAKRLGTIGYMKELKRLQVGDFKIEDSIELEKLKENPSEHLISIEKYFEDKEKIQLNKDKLKLFLNGVQIDVKRENGIYRIYDISGDFVGIGIVNKKLLKRDIIVNEEVYNG